MPTTSEKLNTTEQRFVTTRDGVRLSYEVLGKGQKTVVLACGLGGRLYSWEPLIESIFDDYRIITWDYRGLFESPCRDHSRMSVRDHAEDAFCVLDNEGIASAAWAGWSMGVQVVLEAASMDPSRVDGLVLLNGSWGHTFSTAGQPRGISLAELVRFEHKLVEFVRGNPRVERFAAGLTNRVSIVPVLLLSMLIGRRAFSLRPMLERYVSDATDPDNCSTYLLLLQELDACSSYHRLPTIAAPALIFSGQFDIMTPPWIGREMARRLPNAEHVCVPRGTHFLLAEHPHRVVPRIGEFLERKVRWDHAARSAAG